MIYTNSCFQVHMMGRELLGNVGMKYSETLITLLERGVTTTTNWEKTTHTNASHSIINTTAQMKLELVLTKGADKFHPDTTEKLLIHLMQVHRCNASDNPS